MGQVKAEEKPKREDQGLFLQLPYILIDTLSMSDSASLGFIRFCRQCLQKDKTIKYSGSYRQLAVCIQQSRMTCYRSVEQWVKAGLVTKTETPDDFILTGDLSSLWSKNSDHCKAHQRPKMGQSISTSASQNGTSKAEQRPTLTSTASQNNLSSVPDLNENERKTEDIYTLGDTSVDTFFFGEQEQGSYSQPDTQPDEEKKEEAHPFPGFMTTLIEENEATFEQLDKQLFEGGSDRSWLQETSIQPEQASQAPSELFPEPPKPNKHNIPDLRAGLNDRSQRPPTPAEQKRLDAAEERHKAQMAARREQEIWACYARLLNMPVDQIIRDDFSKRAMKALVQANVTDEHIDLTFKYLKNKKLATTLAFIASNLNSVVADSKPQEKPKSELLNMTDWTDEEYDHWRRTNETPIRTRRIQA